MTAAPTLNGSASTRERLLSHLQALAGKGQGRSQLLVEALHWNKQQPCPLADGDLLGIVGETAPGPRLAPSVAPSTDCPRPADPGQPTVNGSQAAPVRQPSTPPTNNGPAKSVSAQQKDTPKDSGPAVSVSFKNPPQGGSQDNGPGVSVSFNDDSEDREDIERLRAKAVSADAARPTPCPNGAKREPTEEPQQATVSKPAEKVELPLHLPLWEYIIWALEVNSSWEFDREMDGEDFSPLWYFVRALKGHPAFIWLEPPTAWLKLQQALGGDEKSDEVWCQYSADDLETIQVAFLDSWAKVQCPLGDPLNNAALLAHHLPMRLAPETAERRSHGYPRFVSMAGWLQVHAGCNPIFLPVERVGELLGVTPRTVSTYRQWAVEDGYLKRLTAPAKGPGRPADRFRFNVKRFQELLDRAQVGTAYLFEEGR